MNQQTMKESLEWINEHREALGYDPFQSLSESEIEQNLAAIEKTAPYGNDPWR